MRIADLKMEELFIIPEPGYLERTSVLDSVEAAPTGVFFSYLSLPDKRIPEFKNPQSEICNPQF